MKTHMIAAGLLASLVVLVGGCATSAGQTGQAWVSPAAAGSGTTVAAPQGGHGTVAAPGQAAFAEPTVPPPAARTRSSYASGAFAMFGQLPAQAANAPGPSGLDNLRQVTFTIEGNDFDPALDPSGKLLVYASTRHKPTSDIYLQRVEGTAVVQLTNDTANDVMPVFSPDGQRIAFASDRAGNWDLYIMPAQGGQPIQLTSDPGHEIHPSFSPDGRHLVYASQGLQSNQWELVVVEVDKPGNKVFLGPGLFPNWSPVDNRIVYQRARQRGTRWFSVWTVEFVDGEGVRPTEIIASSNAACITPRWSPDASHIVFCTVVDPENTSEPGVRPAQADVWAVAADGSARVNLTANHAVNVQPTWAGDGTIYFVSSRSAGGVENIWSLRPERALTISPATTAKSKNQAPAADQRAVMAPTQ